ncbi:cytochrome P450 [Mollisia scopiformis]|uniref:Cytochrome P450 n=1 Tax=Mollisia scopiformis TaxID=149040 RepID=A0A132B894_MOLSC|nr:cytochrome P450 [Mollisia scopiformis]KUJ08628.1 cytochrome P450 [Mollisia scopiformis]
MISQLTSLSPTSILLLPLLYIFYLFLFNYILDPLRSVPGPYLARFTRWWYFCKLYEGDFERTNVELHKEYGAVVRIAPGEYSLDDVEGARIVYGLGKGFSKAPWYSAWMPPDPSKASLFSDQNAHRHSMQRRKFSSFYSMSALITYEPFVNNCSALFTSRLHSLALTSQVIDLQHWLQCYAFDVIGEITFGSRFGFLDLGEDKEGVFKAIDDRGSYSTFVGVFPWIHQYLYSRLPMTGGHGYVYGYTLRQIENRQKELKNPESKNREGPPDIMTKILLAHEADPEKMTKMDLITMCQSNIGAGSDTTAITLSAILYNLLKHPRTWEKLRTEIDDAEKEGQISDPVTFKEAQSLPYLQAVIKEALRIHSATGLTMPRIVPAEGTTLAGHFFPGGSTIGINAWVAHRNPSIFGADAEEWRPERWLEFEEQGRGAEVEKYSLGFGMGSRTCIGKNISLLEIGKLIPQLVRRFDFQLVGCGDGEELRSLNRWFVKQQGFRGRVFLRGGKR